MSLFSEFDLFRRSVHQLFSEFERDYLNDRYLLDTHFADYPLGLMQQNDNDKDNNNNMQLENQNNQEASKVKTNNKTNNNAPATNNTNNANTGNNNQLQSRGGGGGLMNNRPSASTAALLFSPWSNPLALRSLPPQSSSCRMDVIEKPDHYEVHAELAGIPKENIKIEVVDGLLTLSGEHRSQIEQKSTPPNNNEKENNHNDNTINKDTQSQGHYHYRERSFSSVKRSLRLPENIDTDKIAAKYDNGLLQLTLPKKEIVTPKPINIQIA